MTEASASVRLLLARALGMEFLDFSSASKVEIYVIAIQLY